MNWDRFDICEAHHLFACHWGTDGTATYPRHKAAHLEIFGKLHRIQFRPSPLLRFESLSENGQEIYRSLCERFGYAVPEEYQYQEN